MLSLESRLRAQDRPHLVAAVLRARGLLRMVDGIGTPALISAREADLSGAKEKLKELDAALALELDPGDLSRLQSRSDAFAAFLSQEGAGIPPECLGEYEQAARAFLGEYTRIVAL